MPKLFAENSEEIAVKTLAIWGENIIFRNFKSDELQELFDTFSGSISEMPLSNQRCELQINIHHAPVGFDSEFQKKIRHKGGSSVKKYFLDGSEFLSTSQFRLISPLSENSECGIYATEQGILISNRLQDKIQIDIYTKELAPMLISDIVENYLLVKARENGWLMIHCSGWFVEDLTQLVVGSSGIGKTTQLMRKVSYDYPFFSNDRAFLRIHNGKLEARSFPLPVNIGCGTIRALKLDIPHFDLPDDAKIRLSPQQVMDKFRSNYENWFPVNAIFTISDEDINSNLYWEEDDCHPFWNASFQPRPFETKEKEQFLKHIELVTCICQVHPETKVIIAEHPPIY